MTLCDQSGRGKLTWLRGIKQNGDSTVLFWSSKVAKEGGSSELAKRITQERKCMDCRNDKAAAQVQNDVPYEKGLEPGRAVMLHIGRSL